jgi:hypothetical protein
MNSKYFMSFFSLVGIVIISGAVIAQHSGKAAKRLNDPSEKDKKIMAYELRLSIRSIWEDNTIHCRNLITSIVNALPGSDEANKKLQENQNKLAKILTTYYGNDNATELSKLLSNHFKYSMEIVHSVKTGNNKQRTHLEKIYDENCTKLSDLLSLCNPSISKNSVCSNLGKQMKLLAESATYRKTKNFEAEQKTFEHLHETYISFSDLLSESIVQQFQDLH